MALTPRVFILMFGGIDRLRGVQIIEVFAPVELPFIIIWTRLPVSVLLPESVMRLCERYFLPIL